MRTSDRSASNDAIVARVYSNWVGFDEAIRSHTPNSSGSWEAVKFVTNDRRAPDWYVIFNDPGRELVVRASPNRVLFAIGEPPIMAFRPMHIGQGPGTIVMTCDERLLARRNPARTYVLAHCLTPNWSVRRTYDELRAMPRVEKRKDLSWVTSNDDLLAGQRERLAFLTRLRGAVDFDLFGRGFEPIDDKWDGVAPYRYSIAYENSIAQFYFTEKIMDCFVAETLPIYVGSPAITSFFPERAVVAVDPKDENAPARIAEIIRSDLHEERRDAILEAKRLTMERYNIFARISRFISTYPEPAAPKVEMVFGPTPLAVPLPEQINKSAMNL